MGLINEFSIQLYSVREETAKDFAGVLNKLGEIGYTGVEFAGYGTLTAQEMKKLLTDNNLKSVGSHVGYKKLTETLDAELEYNNVLGTEYIVCPHAEIKTREAALQYAESLSAIAEKVEAAGMKFGYHNHAFEFAKDGDEYLLDVFYKNASKKVFMQLDLYWAAYAGVDYMAYMEANKDKLKMLHIKQIKDFETKKCVDLNEGVLDFNTIIKKTLGYGVQHFILEQEEFAVSPYISVKNGFDYIMSL